VYVAHNNLTTRSYQPSHRSSGLAAVLLVRIGARAVLEKEIQKHIIISMGEIKS